jgi:hypothetical protein
MEEIEGVLQEYVATANNPKYNGDYSVINSKFPELKKYDEDVLREYVATANNKKYSGDYKVINSKFPEFFEVKKKDNSLQNGQKVAKDVTTTPKKKQSLLDIEKKEAPKVLDFSSGKLKTPMSMSLEQAKEDKTRIKTSKEIVGGRVGVAIAKDVIKPVKKVDVFKQKQIQPYTPSLNFEDLSVSDIANINKLKTSEGGLSMNTVKLENGNVVSLNKKDFEAFDFFLKESEGSGTNKTLDTRVSKLDVDDISKEYEDINQPTFVDALKGIANIAVSSVIPTPDKLASLATAEGPVFNIDALSDDKDVVKQQMKSSGMKMNNEQFKAAVKEQYYKRRSEEIFQSKLNKDKENLTPAEQYALSLKAYKGRENLSAENKKDFELKQGAMDTYETLLEEKLKIEADVKELTKGGTKPTQEVLERYNDVIEEIKVNASMVDNAGDRINKRSNDIGTFSQEIQAYSSENRSLSEFNRRLGAGALGMLSGVANTVGTYLGGAIEASGELLPLNTVVGETMKNVLGEKAEELAKRSEDALKGEEVAEGVYFGGVTETKSLETVNDLVNEVHQTIGDNAAVVAMLLTTGGTGLGVLTADTMGHKLSEIKKENNEFRNVAKKALENGDNTFKFLDKTFKTKENVNKDYYSKLTEYAVPILWGGTTLLPMAKQLKYLNGAKRAYTAAGKESADLIRKSLLEQTTKSVKEFTGHSIGLARDLKVMSLSQAVIDDAMGKEVDYYKVASDLKTVRDAFILHGMNVLGAKALSNVSKPFMTNKEAAIIDGNASLIFDLTNRLNYEAMPVSDRAIIENQLNRLKLESEEKIGSVLDRMSKIDDAGYSEVLSLAKKSSELRQEALDIQNSSFSKSQKEYALEKVRKDYVENEKKISSLRDVYNERTDGFYGLKGTDKQNLIDRASKELTNSAKERGEKDYTPKERDINIKASEIYDRESVKSEDVKAEEKNVFFYYEAKGEKAPTEVPEGYTTMKRVENSAEVKLWEKQQGKPTEETVETKVEEEVKPIEKEEIDISMDEIEALEKEVLAEEAKSEGTLSENLGQKVFRGSEEGMLELEGQQIVFKTGDVTNELGNVDVISGENMSSLGLSKFSPEGIKTEGIEGTKKIDVITIEGKEYKFIAKSRDKKGVSVVKVKDTTSGLIKKITGPEAERILKDLALQKPKTTQPIKLTVEGKEVVEVKGLSPKQVRRAEIKKAKEEFEAKSMQEIQELNEKVQKDAKDFEDNLLNQISKEASKDKNLIVTVGEKQYSVTKKSDGEFSVSQKNKEGRFVGVKDAKFRDSAIAEYNKLLEGKDAERIKLAEELSTEFKKEQEDKVIKALDKAISLVSTKGKAFDAMLGIPLFVAEQTLKIIKASYQGSKNLAEALKDGYGFLKSQGAKISEGEYKKWALNELKQKATEVKEEAPTPKKVEPKEKETKKTLKQDVKDIKAQVVDIMSAMREFANMDKKDAVGVQKKKIADLRQAKKDLSKFIRDNVSSRLGPKAYKSLISLVENVTPGNYEKSFEKVSAMVEKIESVKEATKKQNLLSELKKAFDLKTYVYKSKEGSIGKSKITGEAKKELLALQKSWDGVDFEKLSSPEIQDIVESIKQIVEVGKMDNKSKMKNLENRREFIVKQTILSAALKNQSVKPLETDKVEENLAEGNYVVVDGEIYSKREVEDVLDYLNENPNAEVGVIEAVKTNDIANRIFKANNPGLNVFSKAVGAKVLNTSKKAIQGIYKYTTGIRTTFEDLISNDKTNDFVLKNFIEPLEEFESRKILREFNNKNFYEEAINKVFGVTGKKIPVVGSKALNIEKTLLGLRESALRNQWRDFVGKRKTGSVDNTLLSKTKLSFKISNDINLFEGYTESHVIQLYNMLRTQNGVNSLLKLMPKGSTIKDVLPIIEYVNKNAKLKEVADLIPTLYEKVLPELNEALDSNGISIIDKQKYQTSEEVYNSAIKGGSTAQEAKLKADQYQEWLQSLYGDNIPEYIPYVPLSVESTKPAEGVSMDSFTDQYTNKMTTTFGNLKQVSGGGSMVLESMQQTWSRYNKASSTFIEGSMLMSDLNAMLGKTDASRFLASSYGREYVESLKEKSLNIVTGGEQSVNLGGWSKFTGRTNASMIGLNPTSAVAQLTSVGSSYMSLDPAGKIKYLEIIKNKNGENNAYINDIIQHPLTFNRINTGSFNYDVKKVMKASEESGNSLSQTIDNVISDSISFTILSDAVNIVRGGSAYYGVKYEELLNQYKKTMSPEVAKQKAKDEAMIKFYTMIEKTQQSSQEAFMGDYQKNSTARLLTLSAFTGAPVQTGVNGITAVKNIINKRGDAAENYQRAAYNLLALPAIFTAVSTLLTGKDEGEDKKKKVINDYANNVLEQFSILGRVVVIGKDLALESVAPKVLGLSKKRKKSTAESVGRILAKISPFVGKKIRDYDMAVDTQERVPGFRQSLFGTQAVSSIPVADAANRVTRLVTLADSDFKFSDRIKVLTNKINEGDYFNYKKDVEAIKNDSRMVELSKAENTIYMNIVSDAAAEVYKKDRLQEHQLSYVEHHLGILKENGVEYKKENMKYQQYLLDFKEGIASDYVEDINELFKSGKASEVNPLMINMLKEIAQDEKITSDDDKIAVYDYFLDELEKSFEEQNSMFKNLKKQSPGKSRANAILNMFGNFKKDTNSDETLKSTIIKKLVEDKLLDKETEREYFKLIN